MDSFDQRKLDLLQDINKVIEAIDDEVDTFIVSRMHSNPKVREIANEAFEKKKEKTIRIAKEMIEKYG
ncbi:MAG: hypothetical protein QXU40_03315 [Candidatus Pacearchaeota archaeon]